MSTYTHIMFAPDAPMDEVEGTLRLAELAAVSLHGHLVEIQARWEIDRPGHRVIINTTSETGRTLAIIFIGFARREFGGRAVQISNEIEPADLQLEEVEA